MPSHVLQTTNADLPKRGWNLNWALEHWGRQRNKPLQEMVEAQVPGWEGVQGDGEATRRELWRNTGK